MCQFRSNYSGTLKNIWSTQHIWSAPFYSPVPAVQPTQKRFYSSYLHILIFFLYFFFKVNPQLYPRSRHNFFLLNFWSSRQAYCGASCRQKSPLDGVTYFLSTIWQFCVSFYFCFAQEIQKVLPRCMLDKESILTPSLPRGRN